MRALALFSGGLDSLLSIKTIENQGIEVIAIYIKTGFGSRVDNSEKLQNALLKANIKAKLEIIDIKQDYINDVLFNPKYGYGRNFNPCIDCHSKMFNIAKNLLSKYDASFLISGEVVGQRPMSQNTSSLKIVDKLSETKDILLRPMSAKLLPPSLAEINGWVDREKLYDISGRSRAIQMQLAKDFGIEDYESPSGGCLLTDVGFGVRMKDFVKYDKDFVIEDIDIIKFGRHFRLPYNGKLVISRDEKENNIFQKIKHNNFTQAYVKDAIGPLCLVQNNLSKDDHKLALKIILTYYKTTPNTKYEIISDKSYFSSDKFENKSEAHKYLVS